MTPDQFRAALGDLGLSQVGFARLALVDARTVRRWCDGTRAVPGPVVALLGVIAPLRCPIGVHIVTHPIGVHIVTGGGGGGGSHSEPLGGGGMPIVRRWPDDKARDVIDPGALDSQN